MDFSDTAALAAEQLVHRLSERGWSPVEGGVDPAAASELLAEILAVRRFDHSLFLSEAAFDADPQHTGVNPRPGRNLLDRFEDRLGFVEAAPAVTRALTTLLGADYRVLNRKVVCGVPTRAIPAWLRARIEGRPVNNLGAYVRPEARDVTYFHGIDFHQDLIDFPGRPADFLTLYVYLHPVGPHDAPLHILEGSHALGASVFPHRLERAGEERWRFDNGAGGACEARDHVLTGETGSAAFWHACTLHGTQPDAADRERISLRYLFAPGPSRTGRIGEVNAGLAGPLSLQTARLDLDAAGRATVRGAHLAAALD